MYAFRHPKVEYTDKKIRIIKNETNEVFVYDDDKKGIKLETNKKIINYILDNE